MTKSVNKFILGNCLDVMRAMDARTVDLIYLDPPYGKNATYTGLSGASFKDTWNSDDYDDADLQRLLDAVPSLAHLFQFAESVMRKDELAYMHYMSIRLLEMHRVLKDTGSIYLHVDSKMVHSLKLAMDAIFGRKKKINAIVWPYRGGGSTGWASKRYGRGHETILAYHKGAQYTFNPQFTSYPDGYEKTFKDVDEHGRRRKWIVNKNSRTGMGGRWAYMREGVAVTDAWNDIKRLSHSARKEYTGYPTQKPLALMRRIISASSNEGDVVMDPFCGSGSTLIAAQEMGRKWIGIDVSEDAIRTAKTRMARQRVRLL